MIECNAITLKTGKQCEREAFYFCYRCEEHRCRVHIRHDANLAGRRVSLCKTCAHELGREEAAEYFLQAVKETAIRQLKYTKRQETDTARIDKR